ncbi:MAG: hypothetical protein DRJ52_05705 [Thermoprotei archaeon]|nr:MAG: hypothetical protein DRJ52_05705 [Thermoprotei archaeon]
MVRREVKIFIEEELHRQVRNLLKKIPSVLKVKYGIRSISDFYELAILLLIQSLEEELEKKVEEKQAA